MTERTAFFPARQMLIEWRYPERLTYLDVVGQLSDYFRRLLPHVQIDDAARETRFFDKDLELSLRVSPEMVWCSFENEIPLDALSEAAEFIWKPITDLVRPAVLSRIGLRTTSFLLMPSVEEAVSRFRTEFFDYHRDPLKQLGGKPKEVSILLRSEGILEHDGLRIDGVVRVMPVYATDEVAALLTPNELSDFSGGWLIDVDTYAQDLPVHDSTGAIDGLLSGTSQVWQRLNGSKEVADAASS